MKDIIKFITEELLTDDLHLILGVFLGALIFFSVIASLAYWIVEILD